MSESLPLETSADEGTPAAEVEINADLVRSLLQEQHADLAHYPIQFVGEGWDNTLFKLGDHLSIRLPRRKAAAALIRHEQDYLPLLAPQLNIPVPTPVRKGKPCDRYPWDWSILPWLEGQPADVSEMQRGQAKRFGEFLRSLHTPAPPHAPHNPFRGVPLSQRAASTQPILKRLKSSTSLITPKVQRMWENGLSAPPSTDAKWLHGDLHPRNVLVSLGTISGIIDWGDITYGDVATDLSAIWMLFSDTDEQKAALTVYGASADEILRARAWAVSFASFLIETGRKDNARNAAIGERILRNLQRE